VTFEQRPKVVRERAQQTSTGSIFYAVVGGASAKVPSVGMSLAVPFVEATRETRVARSFLTSEHPQSP
jgi:hypothetical protein